MNKKIVIPLAVVGIVIIITIGAGFAISMHKTSSDTPTASGVVPAASATATPAASASAAAGTTATTTPVAAAQRYKDGQYTATGGYTSPGGNETIKVVLTIKADDITAVTVTPASSNDDTAQSYESMFASGISSVVVGKPLASSFNVSEVNGSSLTGTGFSKALQSIRTQATS